MKLLTYITFIVSSTGGMLYGYDIGVTSGVYGTPTFPSYFGITDQITNAEGNITACLQAGATGGALFANFYADKLGRQKAIIISALIFLFGSAMQAGAKNLSMILFGRFAGGWGCGACSMLVPMYLAEISPQNVRGRVGALWQLNIGLGMTLAFWINYGCLVNLPASNAQWQIPLALQMIPGLILLIGTLFLPESLRWLVLRDRFDEAKVILCRLRGFPEDHPDIISEFDQITTAVAMEKAQDISIFHELKHNVRRILLGCFLQIAQQWTGTNAINFYGPLIFQTVGLDSTMSSLMTGVYGCVKVFFCLISFLFLDKKSMGRRQGLILGSIANIIIFFILGGMLQKIETDTALGLTPGAAYGGVGMAMIYLFAVSFEFTWGPLTWIVCSEIFPNRIRAICISLTTSMNWAMNAIIGKVTPLMIASISYNTFYFYGACCITMGLIVLFFVPETKGRTLEEMDEIFMNSGVIVVCQKRQPKPILPTVDSDGDSTKEKNNIQIENISEN